MMPMRMSRRATSKHLGIRAWSSGERYGHKEKCGSCQHVDDKDLQLEENTFRSKNTSVLILAKFPKVAFLHYCYSILILKFVMRFALPLISYSILNK